MIVNPDFAKILLNYDCPTYDEALKLSQELGYGQIPFGEFLLALGMGLYLRKHEVCIDRSVVNLRSYVDPKVASSVNVVREGCCGKGKK